jgi:cyclic beta-1,2-glucan synthetase
MFFYVRNVDTNYVWSSTYAPLNVMSEKYEIVFTADKATYKRTDGQIETETEVVVANGDNAEIRRISHKNFGEEPCVLEVTSYFEVVLANVH